MTRIRWILFTVFMTLGEAHRILVMFFYPAKSHSILGEGLIRPLLDAGHEIVYVTPYPKNESHPKLTQIDISEVIFPVEKIFHLTEIINYNKQLNSNLYAFLNFLTDVTKVVYDNRNIQNMLNDPTQKFDLVIIQWMFVKVHAGLSALYDCPYIWFSNTDPDSMVMTLIDEALHPAYNPLSVSVNVPPFTFFQRVWELQSLVKHTLVMKLFINPRQKLQYESIFSLRMMKRGRTLPSYEEISHNASLILGSSHVSIGLATRLPQNYKAIGGYHINTKVEPLPENVQILMNNSKNGVIYFSMGSNMKSQYFPDAVKRGLLNVFGDLNRTVIWKFEDQLNDLPKNVHILKWAPQQSILAHPNCVLFITHGGLLSSTEAIHFGVPIIGIPVFGDQTANVIKAVGKGIGKKVDLSNELADDLKVAIEEVLNDKSYTNKVKELSFIYHDRPVSPSKELVHWTEHVIRTRGALHLRSPAFMVPWYQKMYIDLLLLIILVLFAILITFKYLFCSNNNVISQKKNS